MLAMMIRKRSFSRPSEEEEEEVSQSSPTISSSRAFRSSQDESFAPCLSADKVSRSNIASTKRTTCGDAKTTKIEAKKIPRFSKDGNRIITKRTSMDILCGRGIPIQTYAGNIRLHQIADERRNGYNRASRQHKPQVIKDIVEMIKADGGRFLKKTKIDGKIDAWEEMDDRFAYEKVGHALRNRKYRLQQEVGKEFDRCLSTMQGCKHSPNEHSWLALSSSESSNRQKTAKGTGYQVIEASKPVLSLLPITNSADFSNQNNRTMAAASSLQSPLQAFSFFPMSSQHQGHTPRSSPGGVELQNLLTALLNHQQYQEQQTGTSQNHLFNPYQQKPGVSEQHILSILASGNLAAGPDITRTQQPSNVQNILATLLPRLHGNPSLPSEPVFHNLLNVHHRNEQAETLLSQILTTNAPDDQAHQSDSLLSSAAGTAHSLPNNGIENQLGSDLRDTYSHSAAPQSVSLGQALLRTFGNQGVGASQNTIHLLSSIFQRNQGHNGTDNIDTLPPRNTFGNKGKN